jgi:Mn-dependent DtxR family transcriptional regulator
MEQILNERDVPKVTVKEIAKRMGRDRHTAWHHITKHGYGRKIGKIILLTENEVSKLLTIARIHNV